MDPASVCFRFQVYFSSKLNIIDACVVAVTLVVTMIYTFSDLSGASLIPRCLLTEIMFNLLSARCLTLTSPSS